MLQPQETHVHLSALSLYVVSILYLSCTMFYISGILLLLLDSSVICGQIIQDVQDESLRVKTEYAQEDLNEYFTSEEIHNVTYEDNEGFQDYIYGYSHCHEELLKLFAYLCCEIFHHNMSALGEQNWCNMEMVIRSYNKLTECMENVSRDSRCYYPNQVVEQQFVRVHQTYFSVCSNEEDLADAPTGVVLVATLLPILLIPFIVYIVVWKSSLRD